MFSELVRDCTEFYESLLAIQTKLKNATNPTRRHRRWQTIFCHRRRKQADTCENNSLFLYFSNLLAFQLSVTKGV